MCWTVLPDLFRKIMVTQIRQKGKDNMPKVTLGKNKYEAADNLIQTRVRGIVNVNGKGNTRSYAAQLTGLQYNTYNNRMNEPGKLQLDTLRRLFEKCNFTDEEVLQICGRR